MPTKFIFTDATIEDLKPQEKRYRAWDTKMPGFGCRVLPTGRKVYLYKYYLKGREDTLTLGKHGAITCAMARKKAAEMSSKVFREIDPKEEKKAAEEDKKNSILFKDFWEIFDTKYIKENHKPTTIVRNKGRIKNYILPFLGEKALNKITKKDLRDFSDRLSHAPGSLAKCLRLISCAFNKAILWEYLPQGANPCLGIEKRADKKMERFLSQEEKERLEDVLQSMLRGPSRYAVQALILLMYTGCRKSEITTLKWEDVHLKDRYLYFKDSKTGTKALPLNDKAIEVLISIEKKINNPYVFPGQNNGAHIGSTDNAWYKARTKANIPDVRLHDLRHSFASFALKHGVDLYTVSKLLGHKNIATTTRYAHLELGALKEATNKVFQ